MAGGAEPKVVEITVKTIGPARPTKLRVSSIIKVCDLRRLVAEDCRLPVERLKLVLRGNTLHDNKNNADCEDVIIRLADADSLIVAVMPKPPARHLHEDDDEEEELKFQIPESTSWLKRRILLLLRDKLRLPDLLLMAIFSIGLKVWFGIILWFLLAPVAQKWGVGPLYILGTGFLIIFFNLGKRQQGDVSAYSIFNEDFMELPGTLNADRLDRDIRAGQF